MAKLPFNREGDFIVKSPRKISGVILTPGDPVDKSKFSTRLLRMFYEHGWIRYAEPGEGTIEASVGGKTTLPRTKEGERGSPGKPEAGEREGQSPSPGDNPPKSDKPPSHQRLKADEADAVEIPEDWEELSWPELRKLASQVSAEPIKNKDQATKAIASEQKRRLAKAA